MTQWRFQSGGGSPTQNQTRYIPLIGNAGSVSAATTESEATTKFYVAYTISLLRVNVTANSGTSTVAFRDDSSSSSNQVLSVTTTGWQEDATGSDTPAADSLCNLIVSAGGSHGNLITVSDSLLTYEHASTMAPLIGGVGSGSASFFYAPGTSNATNATEAETRYRTKRATVVSNFRAVFTTAGASGLTLAIGNNGSSSSNVTLSPTGTGAIEDTTGSESIASGDDLNFRGIRTANTWVISCSQAQLDTESGIQGGSRSGWSATTREFGAFNATPITPTSVDQNYDARMGSVTAANLQCYISGAGSGTRDVTLRVEATNSTNLTISVTGTGFFEDATGSDSVGDTDHIGWSWAATTTEMTVARVAVELPWVTADTSVTSTIASLLAALASDLTAVIPNDSTVSSTFAAVMDSFTATMQPAGTIAILLAPVSSDLTATQVYLSTISSLLAAIDDNLTALQSYPVTISSLLAALDDSLTATMQPSGSIASLLAPVDDSLTVTQVYAATLASVLAAVDDDLTAEQAANEFSTTIASTLAPVDDALTAVQSYPVTVSSLLEALASSLTATMEPAGTIASTFAALESSLTVSQIIPLSIGTTLAALAFDGTLTHEQAATIAALLAPVASDLTATMEPASTLASILAPVATALSAAHVYESTIASILTALASDLTAEQLDGAFAIIDSTLAPVDDSLTVVQSYPTTVASTLAAVAASLAAAHVQASTIEALLAPMEASLTATQDYPTTVAALLAAVIFGSTGLHIPDSMLYGGQTHPRDAQLRRRELSSSPRNARVRRLSQPDIRPRNPAIRRR